MTSLVETVARTRTFGMQGRATLLAWRSHFERELASCRATPAAGDELTELPEDVRRRSASDLEQRVMTAELSLRHIDQLDAGLARMLDTLDHGPEAAVLVLFAIGADLDRLNAHYRAEIAAVTSGSQAQEMRIVGMPDRQQTIKREADGKMSGSLEEDA